MIGRKSKRWLGRYVDGNDISLLHGGEEFFTALEQHIRSASRLVHLQIYILEPDDTGMRIIALLKDAAARGVQVYVVVDAFGSQNLTERHMQELASCGIHIRKFSLLFSGHGMGIGRRMHHKIFLADGEVAITGGLNISNKYRGWKETPWLDYGVKIRGPLCAEIEKVCRLRWKRQFSHGRNPFTAPAPCGTMRARASRNDWFRNRVQISHSYIDMLRMAKKEVLMLSPYFLPGYHLTSVLLRTRRRGVRVVLVLPGISDVPLVKRATEHLYSTFLRHGIEIYEWKESVLHGKIALMDSAWCTIGSYNPNALSDYLSMELNIDIDNADFAAVLHEEVDLRILSRCRRITDDEYARSSSIFSNAMNSVAYYAIWLFLRIQYLMTRRK